MGRASRRVLVVGCGRSGRRAATALLAAPRVEVVGALSAADEDRHGLPVTLLGQVDDLPQVLAETALDGEVEVLVSEDVDAAAVTALVGPSTRVLVATPEGTRRLGGLRVERAGARLLRLRRLGLLALLLVPAAVLSVLVLLETGAVLDRSRLADGGRLTRFRTRRARSLGRPGTTWSLQVAGRTGPVGRLLRRTGLDLLPETVAALAGRRTLPPPRDSRDDALVGAPDPRDASADASADVSADAAGRHHAQVDASQLAG